MFRNEDMGLAELLLYTIVYLAIGGNCYWYKVRSCAGRVVELWPLHDGQIRPVSGGGKLIAHDEFDDGSGTPQPISKSDIVHFQVDARSAGAPQGPGAAGGRCSRSGHRQ